MTFVHLFAQPADQVSDPRGMMNKRKKRESPGWHRGLRKSIRPDEGRNPRTPYGEGASCASNGGVRTMIATRGDDRRGRR